MKIILGDNQFFGVNHSNISRGLETRLKFDSDQKIRDFIKEALTIGLDGFMINSNDLGYRVVNGFDFFNESTECHYSIPYPHKYAGLVNDKGMSALVSLVIKQLRLSDFLSGVKFIFSFNAIYLLPVIIRLEVPRNLPLGSVIYLQNVVTDLILSLKNGDKIIGKYIQTIEQMGYKPGLITLNPGFVHSKLKSLANRELYLCFNFNTSGFNVFPSNESVVETIANIKVKTNWKLMAMSIFSSGRKGVSIEDSIDYVRDFNLDYVVFGSSKISNIKSNYVKLNAQDS